MFDAALDQITASPERHRKAYGERTRYWLGHAYRRSGRTEEAIVAFQQAVKLKPDYASAWKDLGDSYDKAGKKTEAEAAFRKARELDPSLFK